MQDVVTTGDSARELRRPIHQVQRTVARLFPDTPRAGRNRVLRREQVCEIAAELQRRYGKREAVPA